ncbi:hypothetical protein CKA32_003995 [Geitlerinema sp. FC II]|uniref:DUF3611 family protein n=1 Tax=Baaleninema simplex TaxID=2862350 RepID=UPI0003466725|nr:DUF3611 family protein [Baaleninema simplex]MDC0835745.1 DUF3611 family protein [Geitlerinema sp. CS-897]PPT07814.1 hypothetical protein CKA32_003995 [Geitlerinema sp. FC II]
MNKIAIAFRRGGWLGLCLQTILGIIPILILVFVLLFRSSAGRSNFIGIVLSYACLLVLIFTIYWCYRYIQMAEKLDDPERCPPKPEVVRCVWIGIVANVIGAVCGVLVNLGQVGRLLFRVLSVPQGGSTISTPGQGSAVFSQGAGIAPLEIVGLQASINIVAAELVGIIVGGWLLYSLSSRSPSRSTRS